MTAVNGEREKSAMEEWKGGEKNSCGKKQRLILRRIFFFGAVFSALERTCVAEETTDNR